MSNTEDNIINSIEYRNIFNFLFSIPKIIVWRKVEIIRNIEKIFRKVINEYQISGAISLFIKDGT